MPPGSSVSLVLLPPDSQIPVAIRLGTSDAQQAHDLVREAGVTLHNEELVRMDGVPAMFSFTDPDGNGLELYRDRPADQWPRDSEGNLAMFTAQLDLESLLAELPDR